MAARLRVRRVPPREPSTAEQELAAAHALTVGQWRGLRPVDRVRRIESLASGTNEPAAPMNRWGYADDVWQGMSLAERARVRRG